MPTLVQSVVRDQKKKNSCYKMDCREELLRNHIMDSDKLGFKPQFCR